MTAETVDRIPRPLIVAVGAICIGALIGTAAMRLGDVPPRAQGPAEATAEAREAILIRQLDSGGIAILDPATGARYAFLPEGEDGFIRGLIRVIDRQRMQHGVAFDGPLEIVRWESGHLALVDPATEWRAELIGFGADNYATFATLMSRIADIREDAQ